MYHNIPREKLPKITDVLFAVPGSFYVLFGTDDSLILLREQAISVDRVNMEAYGLNRSEQIGFLGSFIPTGGRFYDSK